MRVEIPALGDNSILALEVNTQYTHGGASDRIQLMVSNFETGDRASIELDHVAIWNLIQGLTAAKGNLKVRDA